MGEITTLIRAARLGDRDSLDRLFSLLYEELHRIAHARVRVAGPDGSPHVAIDENVADAAPDRSDEVLRVHHGLEDLGRVDDDLVRLVEMRYFAGLQLQEIARALGVTERTVERRWQKARAILFASLA